MNLHSLGDLAQTFKLRHENVQLKQKMAQLTKELASGKPADLTRQLAGNFGHLVDIEHDLVVLKSYRAAARDADTTTTAMQSALDTIQKLAGDLGETAGISGTTTGGITLDTVGHEGRGALESMVAALNTEVGGRALFSGTEIELAPLTTSDALLADIRTAIAGSLTAADVLTALDTFFDTPGGDFETLTYQGGTTYLSPFQLGNGESVSLNFRADDSAVRNVLKNTVMAALVDDTTITLSDDQRVELAKTAGVRLLTSQDEMIAVRSTLGFAQSRIEQSSTRITTEMSSLEFARDGLMSVDKFQTATELGNVQTQLETLYTLTARSSRFSLVNFLS